MTREIQPKSNMNEAPAIQTPPPCTSDAAVGSPPKLEAPSQPLDPHFRHRIYLDRWKFRGVYVTAPMSVTQAEMDRIKGWIETLFIVVPEEETKLG